MGLQWFVLLLLMLAALWDKRRGRIPNYLIGLGYVLAMGIGIQDGTAPIGLLLWRGIWPVIVLWPAYKRKGLGAGDIKLFSLLSITMSGWSMLEIIFLSLFIGGIAALGQVLLGRDEKSQLGNERDEYLGTRIRLGPYIFVAYCVEKLIFIGGETWITSAF